jgi:hypothetical protein
MSNQSPTNINDPMGRFLVLEAAFKYPLVDNFSTIEYNIKYSMLK